jgi:hypothetical protein
LSLRQVLTNSATRQPSKLLSPLRLDGAALFEADDL